MTLFDFIFGLIHVTMFKECQKSAEMSELPSITIHFEKL